MTAAAAIVLSEGRAVPRTHDATTSQRKRRPFSQLLDLLVRARPLPLGAGIAVATILIGAEALVVYWFQNLGSQMSFRALFMLGVLIVSAGWGFGLSVTTTLVSGVIYF